MATADPLIDQGQLQQQGMTRTWFAQVQMDRGRDRVESAAYNGKMLVVQTKRGVIQSFDTDTGDTLWVKHVGSPNLFTTSTGVGPKHVAVINGSHLFVFDNETGKQIWFRRLTGGVIGGPCVGSNYVFVPKVAGNLEAYSLGKPKPWENVRSVRDTQFPVWRYNSHGNTMVRPALFKESVGWANDKSEFYVARLQPLEILFRVEALANVMVPPVHINSYFYLASVDGYLHKVHALSGNIRWRFSTGDSIVQQPVARDGFIYLATPHRGLFQVIADEEVAKKAGVLQSDKLKEGGEVWSSPDISQVLAVSPDRVFGMDNKGNIRIVSVKSGKSLGLVPTHNVSLPIVNHLDDHIYLLTSDGLIQCLQDSNRVGPQKTRQKPPGNINPNAEEGRNQPGENKGAGKADNPSGIDDDRVPDDSSEDATGDDENPFQ